MSTFRRFELRTTDPPAARAFYSALLGRDDALISALPEQAISRGARPHWLGYVGVPSAPRVAASFVERGAQPIGPSRTGADGEHAIIRDPGGALLGLSTVPPAPEDTSRRAVGPGVEPCWYVLHVDDAPRVATVYVELLGWALTRRVAVPGHGLFQEFAWSAGGPSVGAIADRSQREGVHAHWLFFFKVHDVAKAMALTTASGGNALGPIVLPSGQRACVCDDPEGAAFALLEP